MQALKSQSLPQLADFANLTESSPLLSDLSKTFDAVTSLLRLQSTAVKTRQRLEDRVAKAESNYAMSLTKIESLQDAVRDKEKTIGRLENCMHRERNLMKEGVGKKKTEEVNKEKFKNAKMMADKQFEHEIKKKDVEIAKLKDALRKSAMSFKDKIDSEAKWSKYEVNNFYNGLETDFNMLDSKKTEIYRSQVEESTLLREVAMQFYTDLKETVMELFPKVEVHSHLAWSILNKPMVLVKDTVLKCHKDLVNILKNSRRGLQPKVTVERFEERRDHQRYPDLKVIEETEPSQGRWGKPERPPLSKNQLSQSHVRVSNVAEVNRWEDTDKKKHLSNKSDLRNDFMISGIDSPPHSIEHSRYRTSGDLNIINE